MPFAGLLLPRSCASCGDRARGPLCASCESRVRWIGPAMCARCGHPARVAVDACRDCRGRGFAFERARAAALYEGPARDALMSFKLGGDRRQAAALASPMLLAARALGPVDLATFVPSDPRTLAVRNFNPAEELARAIARASPVPLVPLLRKIERTPDQASLGRDARRRALEGAFESGATAGVVLLVDDIFTTGATADACSAALLRAGARSVRVVTFGRSTRYAP